MRKVLIATPCLTGQLDVWYTNSLIETVRQSYVEQIEVIPIFLSFDSILDKVRNDLFEIAYTNDFDDIFFIDSDQEWHPQYFFDLLKHDVDVVGGAVVKKSDTEESYNVKSVTFPIPRNEDGLLMVDSVGTGFLRISKKVIAELWDSNKPYSDGTGKGKRQICEFKINDSGDFVGEDVVLCDKITALGHQVYVDDAYTGVHMGTKKYYGNFQDWLKRVEVATEESLDD